MRTRPKTFAFAVLLALLLHILLLEFLRNLPEQPASLPPGRIRVQLNDPAKPQKQLVKIRPPVNRNTPRRAEHLAEFDNSVPKETRAANQRPVPALSKQASPQASQKPTRGPMPQRNLLPTWQELQQDSLNQASDFNDQLDDKETAAHTQLNTFEWKYAAYLNRIKDTISQVWSPNSRIRRYDPAGALIGDHVRLTVLEVTIDPTGHVTNSRIKKSSGVFYLDDEALDAFRTTSYFPHPPASLFAVNRQEYRFDFGFAVSMQKGFSISFD